MSNHSYCNFLKLKISIHRFSKTQTLILVFPKPFAAYAVPCSCRARKEMRLGLFWSNRCHVFFLASYLCVRPAALNHRDHKPIHTTSVNPAIITGTSTTTLPLSPRQVLRENAVLCLLSIQHSYSVACVLVNQINPRSQGACVPVEGNRG